MFNNKQERKAVEAELTNASNTIGKGTSIVGDVETFGNIRIDGRVKGNITTKNKLVLGESSFIDGNILAQNAEIEGEVTGRVEVTEMLVLKASARIKGDIIMSKLVVESGASFDGNSQTREASKEITISSFDENGKAPAPATAKIAPAEAKAKSA